MRFGFRSNRSRLIFLRIVILSVTVIPSLLYLFLAYLIPTSPALIPVSLLLSRRPLLVISHPDDETLFFGPTVLGLTLLGEPKELRILVLSTGNNYGLGNTRKMELKNACDRIGAKECIVLDRQDIRDNPTLWWDGAIVTPLVNSWSTKFKADAVITFDSRGVSGHINHRAVSSAVTELAKTDPEFPPTFILRTVSTFFPPRKYSGWLDLPFTSMGYSWRMTVAILCSPRNHLWSSFDSRGWQSYDSRGLFISTIGTWKRNVRAFLAHETQTSWDRWLYMFVSRYMWFNELIKVEPPIAVDSSSLSP